MNKNSRSIIPGFIKYPTVFIVLTLLITTIAVYWQISDYDFINFDDDVYVTTNSYVQSGLSIKNILWAFTTTFANFWHPLTWLSFMLDYQMFGLKPGMFHLSSLFIHLLNTFLLFWVFQKMTGKIWQSAVLSALFALHPLHVESVAWISQRKDLLSTLFWMLTMWGYLLYVKKKTVGRYAVPVLFYIMGLMAKPMLVTLPFVLLLLDVWPLGRFAFKTPPEKNLFSVNRGLIWEKIPYFIITIIFSIVTFYAQRSSDAPKAFVSYPLHARITNALVSYFLYIKKMIFPFDLTLHYPFPAVLPAWQAAGAGLLLVGISVFAVLKARKIPYFLFGWFWFLGTLVPVIGLVQVGLHAMADRYTYVPLIGLFVILVWGLPDMVSNLRYQKPVLAFLTLCILLFCSATTWIQTGYWKNSITVFEHAVNVTSDNYVAHNNLANALVTNGRSEDAISHYHEAIRINPGDAQARNNLGFALVKTGRIEEAIESYSEALRMFPGYSIARFNLGDAVLSQGDMDGFISHYTTALGLKPDSFEAYKTLGDILFKKEKLDEAIGLYYNALKIDPNSEETHTNLGIALVHKGQLARAIPHFKKAVLINADNPKTQSNLERVMVMQEKIKQQIHDTRNELALFPENPSLYVKLGRLYKSFGENEKAIIQFKKSIAIDPNNANMYYEIAALYAQLNNSAESINWLKKSIQKGYNTWDVISRDRDFNSIRNSSSFKIFLKSAPAQER